MTIFTCQINQMLASSTFSYRVENYKYRNPTLTQHSTFVAQIFNKAIKKQTTFEQIHLNDQSGINQCKITILVVTGLSLMAQVLVTQHLGLVQHDRIRRHPTSALIVMEDERSQRKSLEYTELVINKELLNRTEISDIMSQG